MEISMQDIKKLFESIGRDDIDENSDNLLSNGLLDSLDIMKFITEIENFYGEEFDFDFVNDENFKNIINIKNTIKKVYKL